MRSAQEIGFFVLSLLFFAALIVGFLKGSRPPQRLETEPESTSNPLLNAILALVCPGISILVMFGGVWIHFTNNRVYDALIAVPLICGAVCGRRAFRSNRANTLVRVVAVVAVVICVPYALVFLFITAFGVG